jgi:hypothetical protein
MADSFTEARVGQIARLGGTLRLTRRPSDQLVDLDRFAQQRERRL